MISGFIKNTYTPFYYYYRESATRELQHLGWFYVRKLYFCILFEVFVVYCFPRFATFEFQLQWFFHFQMCRSQKKDRNIPLRYTTSISVSDNHYILFFQPFALINLYPKTYSSWDHLRGSQLGYKSIRFELLLFVYSSLNLF